MGITDMIAGFIQEALDDAGGVLEMQRGDLAQRFGCVPSQINYVMSTRFSPEHGYIVESRRGGGGYIRITRVQSEAIPAQTGKLLVSLLSDAALRSVPKDQRSVLRADLLKQALIHLV